MRVKLTVKCPDEHIIGVWYDRIEEKYPFYCPTCEDDCRTDKYPWTLEAEIVESLPEDSGANTGTQPATSG